MIRFGVCAKFDQLDAVMEAGYDYVEFNLSKVASLSEEEFADLEKRIQAASLQSECFNAFFPGDISLVGEAVDMDAIAAYVEKAMSRAARLGGKIAALGSGKARNIPEGFPYEKGYAQFCRVFDLCATIAQKYGITVALETLCARETNLINTFAQTIEICKEVNHPNGKCLADFFHISKAQEPYENICTAGDLLIHVHLAAPNRDMPKTREDIAICRHWAQILNRCGYDGRISLEGHYAPDFKADIIETRKVLELFRQ